MTLRLGTRASALACQQTAEAANALAARGVETAEVLCSTQGDADQRTSLTVLGGQGVFVRALEQELLAGTIDVAVHSAKDVPSAVLEGTVLAAFLPRADVRDVLVSGGLRLSQLSPNASVGSSSRRRAAQIRAARPDLRIAELRGNVDTRLGKREAGDYDAIVLAAAGLARLGRADAISEYLSIDLMLPAPGQGAIVLQARDGDAATLAALAPINDRPTELPVRAERAVMVALGAGCSLPVAALAHLRQDTLSLLARVGDDAGEQLIDVQRDGPAADPEALGQTAGEALLARGAAELLAEVAQ